MDRMDYIKSGIEKLFKTNPNIHVSVRKTHPKVIIDASPAKIVGVYKNIFQVEECEGGKMPARHTFPYGDVLIGQVVIAELDYVPMVSMLNKK